MVGRILVSKKISLVFCALSSAFLTSCAAKDSQESKLQINFPSAAQASGKVSSLAVAWTHACFFVNVTGKYIPAVQSHTCDVPTGAFAGSVAPGGSLSLTVPQGTQRKIEVFAYFRAATTESCPSIKGGFQGLDRRKVARVGEVASVDLLKEFNEVSVSVSLPASGTNLITQYSLPSSCTALNSSPYPGRHSSGLALGTQRSSGGSYVVEGSANGHQSEALLTSSTFKVQVSRKGL